MPASMLVMLAVALVSSVMEAHAASGTLKPVKQGNITHNQVPQRGAADSVRRRLAYDNHRFRHTRRLFDFSVDINLGSSRSSHDRRHYGGNNYYSPAPIYVQQPHVVVQHPNMAWCRKCYGKGRVPGRLWGTSKLCHECNGVGSPVLGACFKCNGTKRVPSAWYALGEKTKCHECNGVGSKI